ncbi:hypothetical protein FBZ83_105348 [Azospirillum brasilense]|uniref:Glycosyltransferase n=1 Tax=Azospirillum brasilense TaxID=192 RepID=A0A560CI01_AZOBR|nr:glycosyltransferase [Azospirillum brasilense]MBK3735323.1 hypothetical protein [Azospirillum brasilense]TWA84467.1 hypothetical protein FBZ83_105348 [Azospirillum brasilense]
MRTLNYSLLCPTRGRPDGLQRLIESVAATAGAVERVEVLAYVDSDDPALPDYKRMFEALAEVGVQLRRFTALVGPPKSVSLSWNDLAASCTGDVLMMANDDQVYVQSGWDHRLDQEIAKFPDDVYCMWFEDGINGEKHCAFPVVSRRWYETLGYFTPGVFEFIANDTWIMDVAKRVERLHFIGDVTVEHRHFSVGKSELDETYLRHRSGENRERIARDMLILDRTWPVRQRDADRLAAIIRSSGDRPVETGDAQ